MADENPANQVEDEELNDLLDSALKDFNKVHKTDKADTSAVDAPESKTGKSTDETSEDSWTTDFFKQAADQFEENLQDLIENGTDSKLEASFQKMALSVASVMTDEENSDKNNANADFQSAIARALNDLQNEAVLSDMLESGPGAILPFMEGMLQRLLSKEVLYPSLEELVNKYSDWLDKMKTTISPNDLQQFTKQLELMRQLCAELEKEKDNDTEDIKKQRYDMVLSLMQEVQGCGQFPEELLGDQTSPFQTDAAEVDPIIPALLRGMESPQNCCLM